MEHLIEIKLRKCFLVLSERGKALRRERAVLGREAEALGRADLARVRLLGGCDG